MVQTSLATGIGHPKSLDRPPAGGLEVPRGEKRFGV
jgi:hypothetical protein